MSNPLIEKVQLWQPSFDITRAEYYCKEGFRTLVNHYRKELCAALHKRGMSGRAMCEAMQTIENEGLAEAGLYKDGCQFRPVEDRVSGQD